MQNPQEAHYEKVHDEYANHYYDDESSKYRKKFIYDILFSYVDADIERAGDLCCGDGFNSLKLKEWCPSLSVQGFDISPTAIASYKELTGNQGQVLDLTRPIPVQLHNSFDLLMCVGGVHHCILDLDQFVNNVCSMLRSGGKFICMEPYASPILDPIRKLWYKLDPYFEASSERALLPGELTRDDLQLGRLHFGGGLAFYLVNNSMIFRMPKRIKRFITPPLLTVEPIFERLLPRYLKGFFIAEYLKVAAFDNLSREHSVAGPKLVDR